MNKEEIEKVLKQMVLELSNEFNYKKAHEDKRKRKNKIYFSYFNINEDLYYVQYGTTDTTNKKRHGGSIEFRYRTGPRIDVYLPDRKGFASLEFSNYNNKTEKFDGDYYYSESQIFKKDGIKLFNKLYERFYELLEILKEEQ